MTQIADGNPQKIWEKLTKEEREDFMKMMKEEKFSDIIEEWLPWWTYKVNTTNNPTIPEYQEHAIHLT